LSPYILLFLFPNSSEAKNPCYDQRQRKGPGSEGVGWAGLPASKSERSIMDINDLENRFTYHPPCNDQAERYERIRAEALRFALLIEGLCPDSRERSLAVTNLEETVMWANASIARNE